MSLIPNRVIEAPTWFSKEWNDVNEKINIVAELIDVNIDWITATSREAFYDRCEKFGVEEEVAIVLDYIKKGKDFIWAKYRMNNRKSIGRVKQLKYDEKKKVIIIKPDLIKSLMNVIRENFGSDKDSE